MKLFDSQDRFGAVSIANHWLLVVVVIGLLASGLLIAEVLPDAGRAALIPLHKAIGVLVAVLVAWVVLWWQVQRGRPGAVPGTPALEARARNAMHIVLLVGTVLLSLSGVLMSINSGHPVNVFGLFTIPAWGENPGLAGPARTVHTVVGYAMVAAVAGHALVSVKHHYVNHDVTFTRMLGRGA
ncbi:cytochrome b [Roseospira goensis]|uniref:Cytochrome b561 n=1 Tax=Roseospira goensis TaxID=391922 RepID=A0A7W6WKP4_9PROT|nr:cytochrome b/b6 domain-containing protein [Roseospira goensis]MBB4286531.1 cytochrome b561 [Roseospira goensis]